MIDVSKPLSYDGGFPKVDNALYRLYPLLDDFTLETTGVYGYIKSWRNNDDGHELFGYSYPTLADMEAQSGLSYHKLTKHIETLKRYDLVREHKSDIVPNKKIFETLEPLTEAEFRAKYPEAIERFEEKLERNKKRVIEDRERRRKKRIETGKAETGINEARKVVDF